MFFRAVGMKEIAKKVYNLDVLVESDSNDFVKELLHDHNVVVLDIAEYPGDAASFGNAGVVVSYNDQDVNIISNLNNMRMLAHKFIMMWFDVKSINFLDWHKMNEKVAAEVLKLAQRDVEMENTLNKDKWQEEEKQEENVYRDEELEKTLAVAAWQINDINNKIYTIWSSVSSKDIKDIRTMEQELWKLRMWRNMDKIVELLEKVLIKALEIKQKYLVTQRPHQRLIMKWSGVTDVDVQSELNILDKAKNISKIGKARTFDDQFYGIFGFAWIQMKFLWKDIVRKITDVDNMLSVLFEFLHYLILFILFICSLTIWFKSLWKSGEVNTYLYIILIMCGVMWLVWHGISHYKAENVIKQIILLGWWILLAIAIYLLIKYYFVL